ncbi:patatin-like phospholipase family protein [Sinomonas sp. 5-5]|uniref:Patatin-like phospholipase family protein n=2 Tax=Sinomonas terrae TaxID=2908838 RepID=A0ABS9U4A7_9MICC|nr:patatin-like phospholipase family protein [Sinomonas terrae]
MTGLLLGLERADVRVRDADVLVGTSAGSVLAAQIAGSTSLEDLYGWQLEGRVEEIRGFLSPEDEAEMSQLRAEAGSMEAANRAVGHFACARGNALRERRRRVIQDRLPVHEWPAGRDLRIVAVDASTGKRMVFTTGSGVGLVEAVEASCAAPGVWPLARVGGHSYMDGGTWSLANVDVAVGADRVLVFAPITQGSHPGHSPAEDLAALGVQGLVVEPSPQSLAAFGTDSLDPQARPGAAESGLAQAAYEAGRIASLM